ncbi:MAG: hypothetical protein ACXW2I_20335, partial [Burkholderiales bacterium]
QLDRTSLLQRVFETLLQLLRAGAFEPQPHDVFAVVRAPAEAGAGFATTMDIHRAVAYHA